MRRGRLRPASIRARAGHDGGPPALDAPGDPVAEHAHAYAAASTHPAATQPASDMLQCTTSPPATENQLRSVHDGIKSWVHWGRTCILYCHGPLVRGGADGAAGLGPSFASRRP